MPSTQAYSVDWDVTIAGQSVNRDVSEVVIEQKQRKPDSCTVVLDTSQKPHAYEEEATVKATIDDGNTAVSFRGRADAVKDDKTDPIVTIDAREPEGAIDDVSAVGVLSEGDLFDVIDTLINDSPGQVRGVTFDPASLKSQYGTFGGSVVFGNLDIIHVANFGINEDTWKKQETTGGQGKSAELQINDYTNNTGVTYSATLTGEDGDGNTVEATFDLPPGDNPQDAFGVDKFKLPIAGGNGLFAEINGINTDVPTFGGAGTSIVNMTATVKNYVRTDWRFRADSDTSVREALDLLVGYISTLDNSEDWEFYVTAPQTGTPELVIQPAAEGTEPDRYIFTEGDNVLRPVANRSLDGVYNMVKVNGAGSVNVWAWAFGGTFYYSFNNPFESGEYPDKPDFNTTYGSTGSVNDIDQIDLRAKGIDASNADDVFQANDIAEDALKQLYRTPVSGVAKTTGLHPADPADEAEVYYPSRGIPAKVVDNVYTVKAVEYQVTPDEATTKVDFGITEPKTGDMLQAASGGGLGGAVRNDLDSGLQNELQQGAGGGSGAFPIVGTIEEVNDDGTYVINGEDGQTYDPVEVI